MQQNKLLILTGALSLALISCGGTDSTWENGKLKVLTSFYPVTFLAKRIGGEKTSVAQVIGNGLEPHDYDLTSNDVKKVHQTDVFFTISDSMEPWASSAYEAIESADRPVWSKLVDGVSNPINYSGSIDPHIWLSPKSYLEASGIVLNTFEKIDPEDKDFYEMNFLTLKTQLTSLDEFYQSEFKDYNNKKFLTSHRAFSYLCRDYNLEYLSIKGLSTEQEPSADDLKKAKDYVESNNLSTIFVESIENENEAKVISSETGAKIEVLNPIEYLTEEDISTSFDYFYFMHKNALKLSKSFDDATK